MKKTIGIIAAFLMISCGLSAQQLPVMNHYIYNPYLYNPARTGQNDYGNIALHFKKQWVTMPNSPFTGAFSVDAPIRTPKLGDMGLGGMLYVDQMHLTTKIGGLGTYAYHIAFEKGKGYKHGLSAGLSLGFINQRLNFPDAVVENPNDNQLLPSEANGISFDFSAGLDYQWRGLHLGVSMLQGLNTGLQFFNVGTSAINYVNTRHWLVFASYKHTFAKEGKKHPWYVEPSFMGRIIENVPFQAEGNIIVGLDGMGWLGVGYRSSNNSTATSALTGTIGVEVSRKFIFAYSVEFAVEGQLLSAMGTQHEFMVAYRFGENKRIKQMQVRMDSMKIENLKLRKELETTREKITEKVETIEKQIEETQTVIEKNTQTIKENKSKIEENGSGIEKNKKELDKLRKLIEEQPLKYKKVGEVFFDSGASNLGETEKSNLDAVKEAINKMEGPNKEIRIYVKGNASTDGDAKRNMTLSMRRAAAVRQYLVSKGIDGEKITIIPMGESDPTNGGLGSAGAESQDRRVDIILTEKKLKGKL